MKRLMAWMMIVSIAGFGIPSTTSAEELPADVIPEGAGDPLAPHPALAGMQAQAAAMGPPAGPAPAAPPPPETEEAARPQPVIDIIESLPPEEAEVVVEIILEIIEVIDTIIEVIIGPPEPEPLPEGVDPADLEPPVIVPGIEVPPPIENELPPDYPIA